MMKLCLMASHGYPPGLVLPQELGINKIIKDSGTFLSSPGTRQEIIPAGFFHPQKNHFDEPWKPVSSLFESSQFIEFNLPSRKPALFDVQDTSPDSIDFSFGIAEQCTRQEKVLEFLKSGSSELEKGGFDLSQISDVMGLQNLKYDVQQQYASSVLYVDKESEKPVFDFMEDMEVSSRIAVQPDGRVLFLGNEIELGDLLSVVAEFYLSRNSTRPRKLASLIPHFARLDGEIQTAMLVSPAKFTVAPLKSPEKTKFNPLPKKNSRKKAKERDLYKRNNFHAVETLLSLMIDRNQSKKTKILSLKKSGSELPELLTQFSAGIAGTGIALLFSVACRLACSPASFSPAGILGILNTGLGFGLVWVSWTVNILREAIVNSTRNGNKVKDEEMMSRVERSIKEVCFRSAVVMAMVVLRVA